ncbi:hypothetical protein AURDEDRAFT_131448 [Auricularia subglabra TFB-10046 SS5]|uniref:F-box domain-containing protein n=1 Tax=Auricularia subglabra (strain TFB-10046 / SS5) TaxID=717982 RepID=J0WNE1_AURST|nr:hypothetical protein AURDEDRAFT_131448 [Auricularia subglabra TFB-10046 SS5]
MTGPVFVLPDDILHCVLDCFDLAQLWSAARVSRQFYRASRRAGMYVHRTIRGSAPEIDTWTEVVAHAIDRDLRIALSVRLLGGSEDRDALHRLFSEIRKALPVLLFLSIQASESHYVELWNQLQDPAPCLRSLTFRSAGSGTIKPPIGLFAGNAPVLRNLGCGLDSLGGQKSPALSNVTRFCTWDCERSQKVSLAHHFHSLQHLMVRFDCDDHIFPPSQVDLTGVTLRSLVSKNVGWADICFFAAHRLPGLTPPEHGKLGSFDEPLGSCCEAHEGGNISVNIVNRCVGFPEGRIRIIPSHGAWRRSYHMSTGELDILRKPGMGLRLEYLRLRCHDIPWIFDCIVELFGLRRIRVDIHWEWQNRVSLAIPIHEHWNTQCPELESVSLHWDQPPTSEPVLDTTTVVRFARGLRTRRRPTLRLGDDDQGRPFKFDRDLLGCGVFSAIHRIPCGMGVILDQFDGDHWNDELAMAANKYLLHSLPW